MTKTVLVTGATGHIGRRAVAALVAAGLPAIAVGRDEQRLQAVPAGAERWTGQRLTSLSPSELRELSGGILFHFAGVAGRDRARGAEAAAALAHAREIAEFADQARLRGVVLASSVYATLAERGAPSEYGMHKAAIERVFRGLEAPAVLTLRLPPVYGEGQAGSILALAKMVRRGFPLPFGLACEKRDYLAIANLADLVVAIAGAAEPAWQALDGLVAEPSDGEPLSTRDLVQMIGEAVGRRPLLLPVPRAPLVWLARRLGKADLADAAFAPLQTTSNQVLGQYLGWEARTGPPASLTFLREAS